MKLEAQIEIVTAILASLNRVRELELELELERALRQRAETLTATDRRYAVVTNYSCIVPRGKSATDP